MSSKKKAEETTSQQPVNEQTQEQAAPNQPEQEAAKEAPKDDCAAKLNEAARKLAEAESKRDEYLDSLRRSQADFINYKRHNERARSDGYEEGNREAIAAVLPVIDNLERAIAAAEKAQETGETIDYKRYVHAVPSKPGTQVMIPAGTIHASGHNQVILEIGSLTVGSYTYKLYDYQRIDPQTGLPRPIHLAAGRKVIHPERTAGWVTENLVNHGGVKRQGEGYVERTVGEHELLYFALHTETFDRVITDDTRDRFHVLALTEGEQVRIESQADPARHFVANYLDVIVVPADFGPYRIVNLGQGPVTVHKTCLKDSFETCAR